MVPRGFLNIYLSSGTCKKTCVQVIFAIARSEVDMPSDLKIVRQQRRNFQYFQTKIASLLQQNIFLFERPAAISLV